ncbi:MAG: hypothetical protein EBZ61_11990, partial [Micrococcales bacterium]|nr:hypothetical protein [Micrococcales bacterium]
VEQAPADAEVVEPVNITLDVIIEKWPNVLQEVTARRKVSGMVMTETLPLSITADGLLAVGFPTEGAHKNFAQAPNPTILQEAISKTLGVTLRLDPIFEPSIKASAKKSKKQKAEEVQESDDSVNAPAVSPIDLVANIFGGEVISDSANKS